LIDFRYHLVSIVAVFLALAIGIVLGSTELQGDALSVLKTTSSSLNSQLAAADAQRDAYGAQAGAAESFLQASESLLLGNGKLLAGRDLVLITEPGAPGSVTDGVRKAAAAAGATVTGQVELQSAFNDLSGATESTLSSVNGAIATSDGTTLAPGTDQQTASQQQAAQLIAGALMTTGTQQGQQPAPGELPTASAQTLLKDYAQDNFITVSQAPAQRATLAVIVTPDSVPSDGASDPTNEVLVAIAQAFASASAVTVIAGATAPSGQSGSAISVVRGSSVSAQVSTIDNADSTQGQITVMQAIATQLAGGKPSSYGISGASSVSPSPAPTPVPTAAASTQPARQPKNGQVKKK
jgi:hypothetical protein